MKSHVGSWSRWVAVLSGLVVICISASALAQVPEQLVQQGRLLTDGGEAVTGDVTVTFSLYDSESGGFVLWQQEKTVSVDDSGFYSVTLGSDSNPINSSALTGGSAWLGVSIDGSAELTPRLALKSVPYAVVAGTAESVGDGAVTSASLASDFSVDASQVANLSWDEVSDKPAAVTDGDDDTLAAMSCASGERPEYDGSSWVCGTSDVDWSQLQSIPEGLGDGDDDTLAELNCTADQMVSYDGSSWVCTTPSVDNDTLADLNCTTDQIASYDGTSWVCTTPESNVLDGSSKEKAAASCLAIKEVNPGATDGKYWLDPDGRPRSNAFEANCDMTYRGGGWTLVGVDVYGDTGSGRLKSGTPVWGKEVVTCATVERSWTDSCWHVHRDLITNNTEVLTKAGKDTGGILDESLAYSMGRFINVYPDTAWYMLVGNHRWWQHGGQVYNFSTKNWEGAEDPGANCNHHSKFRAGGGWVHWNTADTEKCGGSQLTTWGRNDVGGEYVDQTVGDSTNRHPNDAGMMIEVWVRGK